MTIYSLDVLLSLFADAVLLRESLNPTRAGPQYTLKGFGVVNKTKIDVFLELSFFFDDPADVGSLISGSSAFSKTSLNIWKFTVHVLLKPGLENFKHYFTSM